MTFSSHQQIVSFSNPLESKSNLQFPFVVMKQRLQLCKNLTPAQCFKDIVKEEGIKGLYRSYPITVMMNIPFASCVICCNENLKTMVRPWERDHPYAWYILLAGISGGVAGVVTNPLDVVKTRLQTQEVVPSCPTLKEMWEENRRSEIKQTPTNGPPGEKCCIEV